MMEKTFDPAAVESRIAAEWEAAGAFRAGRPERAAAETYTIVIPPPNVTGSLHMGHALNNTLQDILCRYRAHARQGRVVAAGHRPRRHRDANGGGAPVGRGQGSRAAAISAATLSLKKSGRGKPNRAAPSSNQLKRLGASCDWSRERFTMDAGLVQGRAQGLRRAFTCRADLQGQASRQLGPQAADGGFRPRSRERRPSRARSGISDIPSPTRRGGPPTTISWWRRRGRKPCSATAPWRCIPTTNAIPICKAKRWCCRWSAA